MPEMTPPDPAAELLLAIENLTGAQANMILGSMVANVVGGPVHEQRLTDLAALGRARDRLDLALRAALSAPAQAVPLLSAPSQAPAERGAYEAGQHDAVTILTRYVRGDIDRSRLPHVLMPMVDVLAQDQQEEFERGQREARLNTPMPTILPALGCLLERWDAQGEAMATPAAEVRAAAADYLGSLPRYRHADGGHYWLLGQVATKSAATGAWQENALYRSVEKGTLHSRSMTSFLDRFTRVDLEVPQP